MEEGSGVYLSSENGIIELSELELRLLKKGLTGLYEGRYEDSKLIELSYGEEFCKNDMESIAGILEALDHLSRGVNHQ